MSKVGAQAVNIRAILEGEQYFIEDYQREYRWEQKHITDLLEDLTEKFLNSKGEEHYFLGSIIISERGEQQFIIDGQQRLTSLTLLLIYIYRTLEDQKALKDEIYELIYSKGDFNLKVDLRSECMSALLAHGEFSKKQRDESIANIAKRYENIADDFPGHLAGEPKTLSDEPNTLSDKLELPKFAKWLIEKVYLVRITALSNADAFAIFETMNDRGVSLTPIEMLKGYLLTNSPEELRADLNTKWKELVNDLQSIDKGEDADAIKAWLRSQHAQDTRERKTPPDFERIGTEFHRWVPDNLKELEINEEKDFADFISRDFSFYGERYKFIRRVAKDFNYAKENKVEAIHYNAHNNFTLQRTVLLAPLRKKELNDDATILRKLRIVSSYLDILIARRIWNYQSTAYSTMQSNMFLLIKAIRGKDIDGEGGLRDILTRRLEDMKETYDSLETFRLHGRNTPRVRYLLARMTDYVETQSGGESHYHEYIKHEVEHIWANQYEEHEHKNEFENRYEFLDYRDRIGGLLLLPKRFNISYGDLPYTKKHDYYLRENLLAQSLHERAYDRNPGFVKFNNEFERNSELKFEHHSDFKRDDLNKRQALYRELCKQIWNPEKLKGM